MKTHNKPFLGKGWAFPPSFDRGLKRAKMVAGTEDIQQSLDILFSTSLGERIMQPEYGSNLKDFQFEPINYSLIGYLKDLIKNAILFYEPRIQLEAVDITSSNGMEAIGGMLKISLTYKVRETNSRYNYVYDFYLNEGAGQ